MKSKDIRELSPSEIEKKLRDGREEYVNLQMRKQTGQVEHPHRIPELRRELARLETILREKSAAETRA